MLRTLEGIKSDSLYTYKIGILSHLVLSACPLASPLIRSDVLSHSPAIAILACMNSSEIPGHSIEFFPRFFRINQRNSSVWSVRRTREGTFSRIGGLERFPGPSRIGDLSACSVVDNCECKSCKKAFYPIG